ncbi:Protein FLC EXPRESSOR [Morella rubra]|uniref:Protein FLC EXPRESSOR n=1 Tax=Morella rubra TaxID=262757 RepID=A0A6A1VGZ1_9ROSI|nr:Protein FLC EXPRESSOR [Morella rubra]
MEAEVLVVDAMSAELAQVRADVQKLFSSRQELAAQLQAIKDDLARARSESHEVPLSRARLRACEGKFREEGRYASYDEKLQYLYKQLPSDNQNEADGDETE